MTTPEIAVGKPTLVRNDDSWRLGYIVAEIQHGIREHQTVIANHSGLDMWPSKNIDLIHASNLDLALMNLRRGRPTEYEQFLATMLGRTMVEP